MNQTIRRAGTLVNTSTGSLQASKQSGEAISFDLLYTGGLARWDHPRSRQRILSPLTSAAARSDITVYYGPPGNEQQYLCTGVTVTAPVADKTTVSCYSSSGSGSDLVFLVQVGNQFASISNDTFR